MAGRYAAVGTGACADTGCRSVGAHRPGVAFDMLWVRIARGVTRGTVSVGHVSFAHG